MKKRLISFLFLISIMSLSIFVYASSIDGDINLVKGWNLVPGFSDPNRILGGVISPENIKAVYLLKQPEQEYIRVYPDPEFDKLDGIDDDYYEKTSTWVYSDKAGLMEYSFEEPIPIEEFQVYKGWNFIILSKYLIEGEGTGLSDPTLDDVSGNCNIEKAYLFANGNWIDFKSTYPEMDSTLLMTPLVIKVSSDCNLGSLGSDGTSPPGLPMGTEDCVESDGGRNINVKGTATGMSSWLVGDKGSVQVSVTDTCEEDNYNNYLREYYCLNNIVQSEGIFCPEGTTCSNGACN